MLLKQYSGDRNVASSAGTDEKTFRKWAWHIIDAVSWLEGEVVSLKMKCCIIFLILLLTSSNLLIVE